MSTSSFESASELVFNLHAVLCSTKERAQESAARKLTRLRDLLLAGEVLSAEDLTILAAAGITAARREDEAALLVFVNLCIAAAKRGNEGTDEESPLEFFGSLQKLLESPGLGEEAEIAAWALGRGVATLADGTLDALRPIARTFFLSSASVLQLRCLASEDDFLSLALHSKDGHSVSVDSIVAAADSEAGQVVLRDTYLSFALPMTLVGVRRHLLVTREAAHAATQSHPVATRDGHGVAMQGAVSVWETSDCETKKTAAVLAGLACLLTREGPDPIRKGLPFGGKVMLPFLEPRPPSDPNSPRILLDRWTNRWSLFRLTRDSRPDVLASGVGLAGLCVCATGLLKENI